MKDTKHAQTAKGHPMKRRNSSSCWTAAVRDDVHADPFDELEGGHQDILILLESMREALLGLKYRNKRLYTGRTASLLQLCEVLRKRIYPHMAMEEDIFFPFLEAHIPKMTGPLQVLRMEHKDFRIHMKKLTRALGRPTRWGTPFERWFGAIEENFTYLDALLRNHMIEERKILFKEASALLTTAEMKAIRRLFHRALAARH